MLVLMYSFAMSWARLYIWLSNPYIYYFIVVKTSKEVSKVRNELNEKVSEIKRLQFELTRQENEEAVEAVDSLKRLIKTLEKENTILKVGSFMH